MDIEEEIDSEFLEKLKNAQSADLLENLYPEEQEEGVTAINSTRQPKLPEPVDPKCQVCQQNNWKYKCPRCSIRTCSVDCVKKHKKEQSCSGERSKTHFVKRSEYNYDTMMSDYTYLEDIGRRKDAMRRSQADILRLGNHNDSRRSILKSHLTRHGVIFEEMPRGMLRRAQNRTNTDRNKQLFWTIECVFHRSGKEYRFLEHSVPETKTVNRFFHNLLFDENPRGRGSYSKWREDLQDFVKAGLDRFVIGLKKERSRKKTCINLTPHIAHGWRTVLRGERIVEFPTLHIWLEGDVDQDMLMEDKILVIVEPYRRKSDQPAAAEDKEQKAEKEVSG